MRELLNEHFLALGGEQVVLNELRRTSHDCLRTTKVNKRRVYQPVGSEGRTVYWKRRNDLTRAELAWLEDRTRKQGLTMIRDSDVMQIQLDLMDEHGAELAGEVEEEAWRAYEEKEE